VELLNLAFVGTPVLVVATWWRWLEKRDQPLVRSWRSYVVLVGAIAVSLNAALLYTFAAYAFSVPHMEDGSELRNTLGNDVAIPLFVLALTAAAIGKGRARILLAITAVSGMLTWIPAGFL